MGGHLWIAVMSLFWATAGESAGATDLARHALAMLRLTNASTLDASALKAEGCNLAMIRDLSIVDAPNLHTIDVDMFKEMPRLQSIYINQAPKLLRISTLPSLPNLRSFRVLNSGLVEVPNLSRVHETNHDAILHVLDLDGNHISHLSSQALRVRADQVSINYNQLREVPAHAFKNAEIAELSLQGNIQLTTLHAQAFAGNLLLRELDLSYTAVSRLPTTGLGTLEVLRVQHTPTLKVIPSIHDFPSLKEAQLTHHFHCCAFAFPERHDPLRHKLFLAHRGALSEKCRSQQLKQGAATARRRRSLNQNRTRLHDAAGWGSTVADFENDNGGEISSEESYMGDSGSLETGETEEIDEDLDEGFLDVPVQVYGGVINTECGNFTEIKHEVACGPKPDALNPCEDVMGWRWLRASVWVVSSMAVAGNAAVLIVLLSNRRDITVSKLLMCHLAFADLCTGIYLLMLAAVDVVSYGEYFNYAYDWQYGAGCRVAGFLSVFSGQLSVLTLAVITLERWFAIIYAIYLERRITLTRASQIMAVGWLFSVVMAGLPLAGVSDYSSTSICLPVESVGVVDGMFQGSIFLINAAAWLTIVACYVQIYRSLGDKGAGPAAAAASERKMANKMALLVGTDLLCWAPVAFFGVTALAGAPLVDVSHGKVLLVFFYPLNACANPFLYAILTKQYRRDLVSLVARQGWCGWAVARYKAAAIAPPTGHTAVAANTAALVPILMNNLQADPKGPGPLMARTSHPDGYRDFEENAV